MPSVSSRILALCATPLGVFVLAALDSTLFFSMPFGIDAVVIILAARLHDTAWIVPLVATAGSLAGAALTFWMGITIGESGLAGYVPPKRLKKARERIRISGGAITLAVLDLVPPPFPFTPFVLAAGAFEVRATTFFTTLAACRIFRFGLETILAVKYGRRITQWLDSDISREIVTGCIVLTLLLTALSLVRLFRSAKATRRRVAA